MKKVLVGVLAVLVIIGAAMMYLLSGAGELIKTQIEQQGSKFLKTDVSVGNVELAYAEGKLVISNVTIKNPEGFSDKTAFGIGSIVLDLGGATSEPYVVEQVSVDAAQLLYEMDAQGKANLLVLKDNLQSMLPKTEQPTQPEPQTQTAGPNPLVMVNDVSVSATRLALDFENLPTGDLELEQKAYDITLPTFSAGSIGTPDGIPADQVGAAIANAMLDNALAQAKKEVTERAKEEAKDKIMEKAEDKLKSLFKKG